MTGVQTCALPISKKWENKERRTKQKQNKQRIKVNDKKRKPERKTEILWFSVAFCGLARQVRGTELLLAVVVREVFIPPWWCALAPQRRLTERCPPHSPLQLCNGTPVGWTLRGSGQRPPLPPGYGTAGANETVEDKERKQMKPKWRRRLSNRVK